MEHAANRPKPDEYAPAFGAYVELVPDQSVTTTLKEQLDEVVAALQGVSDDQSLVRYAAHKWSLKEVIGHLIDAERVFVYRALRIARRDKTALPGFNENEYVDAAEFNKRSFTDLLSELVATRKSTISFFVTLNSEAWTRTGTVDGHPASVRGLAFVIAGHVNRHLQTIHTKYLPAIRQERELKQS